MFIKLRKAMQWVYNIHKSHSGIVIENYNYDYFSFTTPTSVGDLDFICHILNEILRRDHHDFRIIWVAGELRHTNDPNKVEIVDRED